MPLHGLEHALVLTDDLGATRSFWCDVLGFEVADRPPLAFPGAWLALDGVVCVHLADRAAYEAHLEDVGLGPAAGPVDHLAFAATGHAALMARLEAAGVSAVENDVPGAGFRQLFLHDPNGVRVELNVR